MGKYDGFKCLSCGTAFTAEDDVVVCPDCGTPYHRACFEKEGRCINDELHEKGGTWQPAFERAETASDEPVRCARCGQENPPTGLFCNRCGMPLSNSFSEPRPFNEQPGGAQGNNGNPGNMGQQGYYRGQGPQQGGYGPQGGFGQQGFGPQGMGGFANPNAMRFDQDSDIDGVKLGDLARYVGKNQFSYLTNFIRFGKFGGKVSLNFSALLFPQLYFFYRKMNLLGIIYLLLTVVLSIPTVMMMSAAGYLPSISFVNESYVTSNNFLMIRNLSSSVLMVIQCISAIFANYWYYKIARKKIMQVRSESAGTDEEEIRDTITKRGGVSLAAFILAALVTYALLIGAVFVMNKMG